jgi:hypothetical protein
MIFEIAENYNVTDAIVDCGQKFKTLIAAIKIHTHTIQ